MTIDTTTNTLIQQIQTPILTNLSNFINIIFEPEFLILISIILCIILCIKNKKIKGITLASTMILAGAIVLILKQTIQRTRPLEAISLGSNYSFPSGHATIAVVFFGLTTFLFINKKYKLETIIITISIILIGSLARLYLQVHWLTDILAGLILGGIILTSAIAIYKKLTS